MDKHALNCVTPKEGLNQWLRSQTEFPNVQLAHLSGSFLLFSSTEEFSTADGSVPAPRVRATVNLIFHDTPASQNMLQRPVKAEQLRDWLETVTVGLSAHATAVAVQPSSSLVMPGCQFQLLRWPPAALSENNMDLIRTSALLSRRALQLTELAELNHQSVDSCQLAVEKIVACQRGFLYVHKTFTYFQFPRSTGRFTNSKAGKTFVLPRTYQWNSPAPWTVRRML